METSSFLGDLLILFGVAVVVSYTFRLLHLSTIAGFLVAGALIGPFGLGLIASVTDVEVMAEIGVMLLLFSIGVEFSAEKLLRMKWLAVGGGLIQMLATTLVAGGVIWYFVRSTPLAIFGGLLVALSSTVIALRMLNDHGQAFSPQGSAAVAILVFQDLAVVPIMLFLPVLTGQAEFQIGSFVLTLLLSLVGVGVILAAASFLVPRLIAATIASRSRDIFILSVIFTVLGTAWLTAQAGLSTALGAFVAGLVVSESEYSHQILADVLPFRETFNSLFFVSIGMLLSPGFLASNLGVVLLAAAAVIVIKTAITTGAIALMGMPPRIATIVGIYLAQIGEFSLVLLTTARTAVGLPDTFDQMFLSVILVTMIASPLLAKLADRIGRITGYANPDPQAAVTQTDHTIIIGYGLNGQNVAASLRTRNLPYVILEMNPQTVKKAKKAGEPIYYGDVINETVQRHVGIPRARCAVFAISDPVATRQAVATARKLNKDLYIVARTRYVAEIELLYKEGADTVITEEFETSLEMIRRILDRLGYRPAVIDREVLNIRQQRYERFRGSIEKIPLVPEAEFEPFEVEVRSKSSGKTVAELAIREHTGSTIVAIRRHDYMIPNPAASEILQEGDHVYLIGNEEQIRRAMRLL